MEVWADWQRLARGWGQGIWSNLWARRVFWGVLFAALLTLLLAGQVVPARLPIAEGEPSPIKVVAHRDVVNRVRTEELRRRAEAEVREIYDVDPAVADRALGNLHTTFAEIRRIRALPETDLAAKKRELARTLPGMPDAVLSEVLAAPDGVLARAEDAAAAYLREVLAGRVGPQDLDALRARVDEWQPAGLEKGNLLFLTRELVKAQIRPNLVPNPAATAAARQQARESVPPVIVKKGAKVVDRDEQVTHEQYEILKDLGYVGPPAGRRKVVGLALFCSLAVVLVGMALQRYRPDLWVRDSSVVMVGFILVLTMVVALLARPFSGYAMPLALGTLLLTILLDPRVAVVVAVALGLLVGLVAEGDWTVPAVTSLGAVAGVYSLRRMETRGDLVRAGLVVSAACVLALVALHLVQAATWDTAFLRDLGMGALNGILSSVLAAGSLPMLESLFGVLTPIKLLELANPNHPLLKKLLVEAPGTYHHTILVANLCEAAAEAIGADPMLARVGAYYHDIGKAKRPYFFTENQMGGENPHDKLPPHLSALIIAAHVKDGVEMAREKRLPEEIIDFIREHHGTTLISYFYHKAAQNGTSEHVLEEDFRYEGHRPRRKETAICMLADGCEAAVRALRQKGPLTQDQIEDQVRKIIQDRLRQGQLDQSDLTLRDLATIQRTFVRVLGSVYHTRVEYPNLEQGQRADQRDGSADQRPAGQGARDAGDGAVGGAGGGAGAGAGGGAPGA